MTTLVIVGLAATFRADAALETVTLPTVSYPLTQTDFSAGLQVTPFNSALGQLQSVTISAAGTASFMQYYQNLSTRSADFFTFSQTVDLILSLPAGGTGSLLDLNLSSGTKTYATQPLFSGVSGGSATFTVSGSSSTILQNSAPDFAQFTGSGPVNLLLAANSSSVITETNGNYLAGGQTFANLDLTVAYHYLAFTAVPEPSTWMAGIFAVGGLVTYLGRSRRRTA